MKGRAALATAVLVVVFGLAAAVVMRGEPRDEVTLTPARPTTTSSSTSTSTSSSSVPVSTTSSLLAAEPTTTTAPPRRSTSIPMGAPMAVAVQVDRTVVVGEDEGRGVIAVSADRGRTWTWQCTAGPLTAVSFLDEDRGFAVSASGATLHATHDGGRTWQSQPLRLPVQSIIDLLFLDTRNGFIAATAPSSSGVGDGLLAVTSDGGRSWRSTTLGNVRLGRIWAAVDRSEVLVAGSTADGDARVLSLARDGEWTTTPVTGVDDLRAITELGDARLAVGASAAVDGDLAGPSMATRAMAGSSWTALASSPVGVWWDAVTLPGVVIAGGQLRFDPAIVWSRDGGASWQSFQPPQGTGGAYLDLDTSGQRVAAVGFQPGLALSDDSGRTWRRVPQQRTPAC